MGFFTKMSMTLGFLRKKTKILGFVKIVLLEILMFFLESQGVEKLLLGLMSFLKQLLGIDGMRHFSYIIQYLL